MRRSLPLRSIRLINRIYSAWRSPVPKKHRFKTLLVGLISAISLAFVSCTSNAAPLRIGTTTGLSYNNVYLAQRLGYYDQQDIRLINYPTVEDKNRAFRNQQLDGLLLSLGDALLLSDTDPHLKIVLILSSSCGADAVITRNPIKSLYELKKQTVAIEASSRGTLMLTRLLDLAGLTIEDIQVVPLDLNDQINSFRQSSVSTIITYEPILSQLIAEGAQEVFSSHQMLNEIVDVLLVRDDSIESYKLALQELINGWFKAQEYYRNKPQDAAKIIFARNKLMSKELFKAMQGIHEYTLEENARMLSLKESWLEKCVHKLQEELAQSHHLQKIYPLEELIDNHLIEALASNQ